MKLKKDLAPSTKVLITSESAGPRAGWGSYKLRQKSYLVWAHCRCRLPATNKIATWRLPRQWQSGFAYTPSPNDSSEGPIRLFQMWWHAFNHRSNGIYYIHIMYFSRPYSSCMSPCVFNVYFVLSCVTQGTNLISLNTHKNKGWRHQKQQQRTTSKSALIENARLGDTLKPLTSFMHTHLYMHPHARISPLSANCAVSSDCAWLRWAILW